MDNSLRLQYLKAMGIEVWLPKSKVPNLGIEVVEPATNAKIDVHQDDPYAQMDWTSLISVPRNASECLLVTSGVESPTAAWLLLVEVEPQTQEVELLLSDLWLATGVKLEQRVMVMLTNEQAHSQSWDNRGDYLKRLIELLQPKVILLMGGLVAQNLLETTATTPELRAGKQSLVIKGLDIPVVVTFNPAHLLASPLDKRLVWGDLQLAVNTFGQ